MNLPQVIFHRKFGKQYAKLSSTDKKKFRKRLKLLLEDPYQPLLHNHQLHGPYRHYRSINIGGDLRAVYRPEKDVLVFVVIGSHAELY